MEYKLKPNLEKAWCWEHNVVCAVVTFLEQKKWVVTSVADTEKREAGIDILAERDGHQLIVEAKGYPSETYERGLMAGQRKRTRPSTQARHWIGEVILTAMLRQSENPHALVAIAIPNFPVYIKLLERLQDALQKIDLIVLVVHENQNIVVENGFL